MRILINQTPALRQRSGMGHYIADMIRCLAAQAGDDRLLLYPGRWTHLGIMGVHHLAGVLAGIKKRLKRGSADKPRQAEGANRRNGWGRRLLDWHFQAFGTRWDADLYHEPNYIPFPCDKPTIISVADLSALLHPHWHPLDRVQHFAQNFARGLAQSRHVITISEFSRQEILKHLPVRPENITCTYMGVRPCFEPWPGEKVAPVLQRLGLPPSYLFFVGTLEPRKNLLMLLRAYCDLPAGVREQCPLVLAGGWGWNTADLAEFYHSQARHKHVIHLGYTAEADLPALYNGARALVFPSHYEGFGLPPLEMMACGGPVLASTAGALVEILGSKAHLINPLDQAGWQEAMGRVITDDDWHRQLRQGVRDVARPYTWERCAADTWNVYRKVLGSTKVVGRAAA